MSAHVKVWRTRYADCWLWDCREGDTCPGYVSGYGAAPTHAEALAAACAHIKEHS